MIGPVAVGSALPIHSKHSPLIQLRSSSARRNVACHRGDDNHYQEERVINQIKQVSIISATTHNQLSVGLNK